MCIRLIDWVFVHYFTERREWLKSFLNSLLQFPTNPNWNQLMHKCSTSSTSIEKPNLFSHYPVDHHNYAWAVFFYFTRKRHTEKNYFQVESYIILALSAKQIGSTYLFKKRRGLFMVVAGGGYWQKPPCTFAQFVPKQLGEALRDSSAVPTYYEKRSTLSRRQFSSWS